MHGGSEVPWAIACTRWEHCPTVGVEDIEMPTAKPRYDSDGTWKYRTYTEASWNALTKRVQKELRRYYPDKNATSDPSFGHPADDWAIGLLNVAHDEISMTNWLSRRLTNEELRAERADILKILNRADKSLSNLSHDLSVLFGPRGRCTWLPGPN